MKKAIKRIFFKFFSAIIPELKILTDPSYEWSFIKSSTNNCNIDKLVRLIPPYKLNDVTIGKGTYVSSNSVISMTEIGNFCSIGPNFLSGWGIHPTNGISTSPAFYSTAKQNGFTYASENKINEREKIRIGNDVFIGANVVILDGITIGDGAIIGAGAVVSKDIPAYSIAVGCPIKVIRQRLPEKTASDLMALKWWDMKDDELQDFEKYFFDIEGFIAKHK